jgi:hypothetical protein
MNCMGIFTSSMYVIFYLLNINHASYKENTCSCILLLPRNEPVILNFSFILSHATVETQYLFSQSLQWLFFPHTYFAKVKQYLTIWAISLWVFTYIRCTNYYLFSKLWANFHLYKRLPLTNWLFFLPVVSSWIFQNAQNITVSIGGLHRSSHISTSFTVLITLALDGGGSLMPRLGRFTPRYDLVPIV